ncbi:Alpha/Beta hydrolase protein [Xylariales sp. AK1849]|nr:Alpha/Beta hydrolase protein [Xylariales sp. AK1849]
MILGPVSYLDCLAFCVFLAPQLLIHVGIFELVGVVLQCLPFLLFKLPLGFIYERLFVAQAKRSPFVQIAAPFEDFVIRCVRYAFANLPPRVGRVFFSKQVALPFLRFRMARHGYLKCPVHWHEFSDKRFKGIWIIKDPMKTPDVCIYYAHGGGFSMGSSYFYLEFLLTWLSMLGESGFQNPAIFALEYTLVPDRTFPTQLHEAIAGYNHVLSMVRDASKICVSGDSAGATVVLSLLLHLANPDYSSHKMNGTATWRLAQPGMAALISPWVTLISRKHRNTASDYLDEGNLHQYASEYVGKEADAGDPLISPGNCRDAGWWKKACPRGGMYFAYGAEEVFAPEIEDLISFLEKIDINVNSREETGGIHAWPVASLFLSTSTQNRQKGLRSIVQQIQETIPMS